MSLVSIFVNGRLVDLRVGQQYLSRLTMIEVRNLVANILLFCPEVRAEIEKWLQEGKIASVAEVLGGEK